MNLTTAQLATLKADIIADQVLNALPRTPDGFAAMADAYNLVFSPDFWVWRTKVTQLEIVTATTQDGTNWSWPDFIARSQGERDGWREMFADGGSVNAALANTRQGFADIFSGGAGAAQRTHLSTIGRRKATRGEHLFATGTGSTAVPAIMGAEGNVTGPNVTAAFAS